ncbi:MAG: cation:proton antiporter [Pirellulales bacterium]
MHTELIVLVKLSACLSGALILGFITQRLKLSPIVGYLLAGVAVGHHTPGFSADQASAALFAEIGIVLLMFGVGLHFKLGDLLAVRRVALPGALAQVLIAATLATLIARVAGRSWSAAAIIGLSTSIASTVVVTRLLNDHDALETEQGHIAVGWLIVQDILTVLVLVLLPALASAKGNNTPDTSGVLAALGIALLKVVLLIAIVLWAGKKLVPRLLEHVARTRTRELFTLAILAVALTIATSSAWLFGVSMALGAFLAGMVVGQSEVSHQAAADALPMRDAFAVLFFVSVGMLFDPSIVWQHLGLFVALLAVIILASPLLSFTLIWLLGYSVSAALTVAVGIAQIGEFSFILAGVAEEHGLISADGASLLVACSIVSISLSPLLFGGVEPLLEWMRQQPRLWKLLAHRSELRAARVPSPSVELADQTARRPRAIIVGYGPVGQTASSLLREFGVEPVIVDLNIDTVTALAANGQLAVYGDAARREILEASGAATAQYLLITTPDPHTRTIVIIIARELNPELKVFARARYLGERAWLEEIGATEVCFEEAEVAIGLAALLLREMGADEERVRRDLRRARVRLAFQAWEQDS